MKKAAELTQRQYLKMRHHLVELRTEQYTYRDSVCNTILPHTDIYPIEPEEPFRFDADMGILPFGLHDGSQWAEKVFQIAPEPLSFTEEDLKKVSNQIWKKPEYN
jgi:hypothetical protein